VRVIVVGAGIVGVTTAWELAAEGHEVVVVERRAGVASEGSFANAGIVSPGLVEPGTLLVHGPASARLRPSLAGGLRHLPWLWRSLLAGRERVRAAPARSLLALALASRQRQLSLALALELDYQQGLGQLVLLRKPRELKRARAWTAHLAERGIEAHLLDAAQAREIEPSLNPAMPLHAAVHLPQDGVGNSRQFAHLLKADAQRRGTQFRFECNVVALEPGGTPAVRLADGHRLEAGAVVLCTGGAGAALLAPLKLRLPLAPVWSVSVTAPVNQVDGTLPSAPLAALTDLHHHVSISRLGQRVRVTGGAVLGTTFDQPGTAPSMAMLRRLYRVLDDWFPGAAVMRQAQHWTGARPALPDGAPLLGASGIPGVFLNLGHGEHGWALACGSAQALAAALAGRDPGIDLAPLGIGRFR
jgi:D-amino-acid dehydrogenase